MGINDGKKRLLQELDEVKSRFSLSQNEKR